MGPLEQLANVLGAPYRTCVEYVNGLRALRVTLPASGLTVEVMAVDDHFVVAFDADSDLEAIAPVAAIGLAHRRVTAMLAPAVTS